VVAKEWTEKELKYLRKNINNRTDSELVEDLKRTIGSVRKAMYRYGIKRTWPEQGPDKQVKSNVPSKYKNKGSWPKGQSGNPKGRLKKGETLTDNLREHIDKDEIAQKLIKLMRKGNVAATKYIYDRLDGKPQQTIKVGSEKDAEWLKLFGDVKNEAKKKVEKVKEDDGNE